MSMNLRTTTCTIISINITFAAAAAAANAAVLQRCSYLFAVAFFSLKRSRTKHSRAFSYLESLFFTRITTIIWVNNKDAGSETTIAATAATINLSARLLLDRNIRGRHSLARDLRDES